MTNSVLMLSWEYPPRIIGGLARVVAELSGQIAKRPWQVHVITADHPGTPEYERIDGVHVHRVKSQTDPAPDFLTWVHKLNFGLIQHAIRIHREHPVSIIHAHDWMVTDAAWSLKTGFDIPMVATMHATEHGRMHGLWNDMQRHIHQVEWRLTFEAWKVIVNSHHMEGELKHLFQLPDNKTVIIPNGCNPGQFDFDFDPEPLRAHYAHPSEKIVLFVGRMVMEKGVQVLLDAIPRILPECPSTRFLLVGSGYYLDDLKRHAENLNLGDRVRFLGYVPDDDLVRLYKIADVVTIPSLYEPFGIVALEGMAARVPVVTSDSGGLTDFVEHMQTGITTYRGDPASLAWGILEVLRNPELARNLRDAAYNAVQDTYNWDVIADKTLAVYEKVLKESRLKASDPRTDAVPVIPSSPPVAVPPGDHPADRS